MTNLFLCGTIRISQEKREALNKKLTDYDIYLIREWWSTGEYTRQQLGAKFNVSWQRIAQLVRGVERKFTGRDIYAKTNWSPGNFDQIAVDIHGKVIPNGTHGVTWVSSSWNNGPPGGIKNSMIHYQDNHLMRYKAYEKERSEYDEDDFWKYTI